MVFLLLYAMAIWAVALVWRRRWPSFLAVLLSIPPVAGATHLTVLYTAGLEDGPHEWIYPVGGAYAALILGVGLLIAVQPRRRPDEACPMCHYDVAGLANVCPECGGALGAPEGRLHRLRSEQRKAEREMTARAAQTTPDAETSAESRGRLLQAVRRAGVGARA